MTVYIKTIIIFLLLFSISMNSDRIFTSVLKNNIFSYGTAKKVCMVINVDKDLHNRMFSGSKFHT